jgi:integrase/recombinase XerD
VVLGMDTYFAEPTASGTLIEVSDPLRLAVAAYLARFKGQSRTHAESDLLTYLVWCQEHDLPPLTARRAHVELYVRWMQEVRRFKSSSVSRRVSILAGFYRTCVIDGLSNTHQPTTSDDHGSPTTPRP